MPPTSPVATSGAPARLFRRRSLLRTAIAGTGIVVTSLVVSWCLVLTEISQRPPTTRWPIFVGAALLMLATERMPAAWIRFGPIGVVTPIWFFSFAMLLVGSPSLTVGLAALCATLHAIRRDMSSSDLIVRVASTALSLSAAGLVSLSISPGRSVVVIEQLDSQWASAVALGGITIVGLNALTAATWFSARRRSRFSSLLRNGVASRVTAEGALLSLAPIWVAGVLVTPVLVPLLAITTILVFGSVRESLEQAHQSRHDQLTGLLNRQAFLAEVDDVIDSRRRHGKALVLVMDLNGFKDINDRLGHQIGDALLVAFADRLESCRPSDAEVARLGGDEFAVVVRNADDDAERLVAQLHDYLTEPLVVEGFPISAGVSVGVAVIDRDAHSTADIIAAADTAMYKAKRTHGRVATYDQCLQIHQHGRLDLLGELSAALEHGRLHLNFQPQLRLDDGSVDTLEALIRWEHPDHGLIPPSEFIGLAEQTDLIEPITELVLRNATQGLMGGRVPVRLAVNVSPRSLDNADFVSRLFEVLRQAEFPPNRLELEMTERELVRNPERTGYAIERLRAQGVRIAIDDFGIGYSSYQTLRLFDVDRVKIDREFVAGVLTSTRDRTIVASLIRLAHDLGLDVVAEGVESPAVWNALQSLGCDVAQGYGIAVPMDYIELRHWMDQWEAARAPSQSGFERSDSLAG